MRAALALVAALVAAGAPACGSGAAGGGHEPSPLERDVRAGLIGQLGERLTVGAVRCGDGACRAEIGGVEIPIAVAHDDGVVTWQIAGLVIATAPLTDYLAGLLADRGLAAAVDCGPAVRVAQPGDRLECRLGAAGRAWAVVDDHGDFAIELALGDAAVAARTQPVAVERLDVQLHELYRDDASVEDDERADQPDEAVGDAATAAVAVPDPGM